MWPNPVVLVRKKNGNMRSCVDFRRLNDLVSLDAFELPRIQELMEELRNMKYFSIIDLKDGFFQKPIETDDCEKTTFVVGESLCNLGECHKGLKIARQISKEP
jgi:hypothetical protein